MELCVEVCGAMCEGGCRDGCRGVSRDVHTGLCREARWDGCEDAGLRWVPTCAWKRVETSVEAFVVFAT